jgi:hypothetical protein
MGEIKHVSSLTPMMPACDVANSCTVLIGTSAQLIFIAQSLMA